MPTRVLFLCIHNSARSQMAEAYLKKLGGAAYEVFSAGLEPGTLNPLAVNAMALDGVDISKNLTKSVFDYFEKGTSFDYVITVCDASSADKCPVFPGVNKKFSWDFQDPSQLKGNPVEKLNQTILVRDQIKQAVLDFIKLNSNK
ncbi:MAG TPA: arsenate reductase ArsC [Saprospiraceae bacterium]|nr:arsenate reductase ArsC [Saprospiraceae bacterium]